jgi:hypothetical protein
MARSRILLLCGTLVFLEAAAPRQRASLLSKQAFTSDEACEGSNKDLCTVVMGNRTIYSVPFDRLASEYFEMRSPRRLGGRMWGSKQGATMRLEPATASPTKLATEAPSKAVLELTPAPGWPLNSTLKVQNLSSLAISLPAKDIRATPATLSHALQMVIAAGILCALVLGILLALSPPKKRSRDEAAATDAAYVEPFLNTTEAVGPALTPAGKRSLFPKLSPKRRQALMEVVTALYHRYWREDESDETYDLMELDPEEVDDLSDSQLWNQFVVFFIKKCCPGYNSSRKNALLYELKPALERMEAIITSSAASQKPGGFVSLNAKNALDDGAFGLKQGDSKYSDKNLDSAGRVLLYLMVFLRIELIVPLFMAATDPAAPLQNVVRAAASAVQGAADMSSVAVHVLTPAGAKIVRTQCGQGYIKANLDFTIFYIGLCLNWLNRCRHSYRVAAAMWLATTAYITQWVGKAENFSGHSTAASQNWILHSLGIPITWLTTSCWTFDRDWMLQHGFKVDDEFALRLVISMIIEEQEAVSMLLLYPAKVAENLPVREDTDVANRTGTGLDDPRDRNFDRAPQEITVSWRREVTDFVAWLRSYGEGNPMLGDWQRAFPDNHGGPAVDAILEDQHSYVKRFKREGDYEYFCVHASPEQMLQMCKGNYKYCAYIDEGGGVEGEGARCYRQIEDEHVGTAFCAMHSHCTAANTGFARGSQSNRQGPVQRGRDGSTYDLVQLRLDCNELLAQDVRDWESQEHYGWKRCRCASSNCSNRYFQLQCHNYVSTKRLVDGKFIAVNDGRCKGCAYLARQNRGRTVSSPDWNLMRPLQFDEHGALLVPWHADEPV